MATGWGVGNDAMGNGTTPDDVQTITAAEYATAGIIKGCEVTTTSSMAYNISAGAVVVKISTDRMVRVPVQAQNNIPTAAAPATGSRTDIIYVKQNFPATDGNSAVVVGVATTLPDNSVEIGRRIISAGNTATSQGAAAGNRIYAQLTGASRNLLATHRDTDTAVHKPGEVITRGATSFVLPTDRLVEFRMTGVIAAENWNTRTTAAPFGQWGTVKIKLYVDDTVQGTWEHYFDTFNRAAAISHLIEITPGVHTVRYTLETAYTPPSMSGKWKVVSGTAENYPGLRFHILDRGVAVV